MSLADEGGAHSRPRVPAVGGERTVPAPDPVAEAYLLLALRIDQRDPGFVDAYVGPADLKATVDMEQPPALDQLRAGVDELRAQVAGEVRAADRRTWLDAQLVAFGSRLDVLAGHDVPYLDQVETAFQWRPRRRTEEEFDAAAAELERLLPGDDPLEARLAAWDDRLTIPPDRLGPVGEWLLSDLRSRAAPRFGVPDGESCRLGLVRGQPWSGYCWFDGGGRSRIDLNLDLPIRAPELIDVIAHETYAGHHLEHAWKEIDLVEHEGRLEHEVLTLLTPECLISEGLAELGSHLLIPHGERVDLLVEVLERAGLEVAASRATAREAAERAVGLRPHRRRLGETAVNAALLRWVDGADSDETFAYLRRYGRYPEARARKRLEFIEHPMWRTYVHVYDEGEPLLRSWVETRPDGDRDAAFRRLLREPLTPATLAAEVDRDA